MSTSERAKVQWEVRRSERASRWASGVWAKGCDMRATCASCGAKPVTIAAQRLQDTCIKNLSHGENASMMTMMSDFCAAVVFAHMRSRWIPVASVPIPSVKFGQLVPRHKLEERLPPNCTRRVGPSSAHAKASHATSELFLAVCPMR